MHTVHGIPVPEPSPMVIRAWSTHHLRMKNARPANAEQRRVRFNCGRIREPGKRKAVYQILDSRTASEHTTVCGNSRHQGTDTPGWQAQRESHGAHA